MRTNYVNSIVEAYQNKTLRGTGKAQNTTVGNLNFAQYLQNKLVADTVKVAEYTGYLKVKYGNVMVKSVGKDQKRMDKLGAGTYGMNNVVIASNILELMANDPKKAAYYERKIQDYLDTIPRCQAELSAMGHEIHSSGIVIHPDGTVTRYIYGDLEPEVKEKIEAQMKAGDEKAKHIKQYRETGADVTEKRRLMIKQLEQMQMMAKACILASYAKTSVLKPSVLRIGMLANPYGNMLYGSGRYQNSLVSTKNTGLVADFLLLNRMYQNYSKDFSLLNNYLLTAMHVLATGNMRSGLNSTNSIQQAFINALL